MPDSTQCERGHLVVPQNAQMEAWTADMAGGGRTCAAVEVYIGAMLYGARAVGIIASSCAGSLGACA